MKFIGNPMDKEDALKTPGVVEKVAGRDPNDYTGQYMALHSQTATSNLSAPVPLPGKRSVHNRQL